MMRYGAGDSGILSPSPVERKKQEKHDNRPKDLGERIIKSLAQMRANENKTAIQPMHEEQPTEPSTPAVEIRKPELKQGPTEPQPIAKKVTSEKLINVQSETLPKRESTPTPHVQAARFYSRTLQERVWLVFEYPGERSAYGAVQQILGLTDGSPWKIYPRSFRPSDGYSCYFGDEIPQLRGKSPEEL